MTFAALLGGFIIGFVAAIFGMESIDNKRVKRGLFVLNGRVFKLVEIDPKETKE